MATLTFLDSSVLIAAHRGQPPERQRALALLSDPSRVFVASPFLYLETMPKAIYNGNAVEVQFYRTYFDAVSVMINDVQEITRIAQEEAEHCGLAAMDALHVAAAHIGEAKALVTLEREAEPMFRTSLVRVVAL